jgi:hypothetical protein
MAQHWVMDFETLSNCFIACFESHKSNETREFVVHELRNDFPQLLEFLVSNWKNDEWHISYNGINFDGQITEFILRKHKELSKLSGDEIAKRLYARAQEVIGTGDEENDRKAKFWEGSMKIRQLDVYRLNHWDNANKSASLKWIQFSMDWHNIQEMPLHHSTKVTTLDQINMILGYCFNDVKSTKNIFKLSEKQIRLRMDISEKYSIPCLSYSNTKIGSEILLQLYCEKTGRDFREVKQGRTHRPEIVVDDIIFDYVKFKTPEFQALLSNMRSRVLKGTKKELEYHSYFKGYEFDYGQGGVHQCIKPGIYIADDEYVVKDVDVAGFYPSLAVANRMYPAHLGPEFFEVYKNDVVDYRLSEKAKGDKGNKAIVEAFKEAGNASYGNSNQKHSFLYDPLYTMKTTINGQLMLTMLIEDMLTSMEGAQLLQTNTDGATFRIKRKDISKFEQVCKNWETTTSLKLEFSDYTKMYIWDVNNYIAVYESGKTKCKGRFEWEDLQSYKTSHLHKSKSGLIVAKAIFNYFINKIPPERFLQENRNIFDYCKGVRIKSDSEFRQTCVVDGKVEETKLQKTLRYYVSNSGCKILKYKLGDNSKSHLEKGPWMVTLFNQYEKKEWADYDVDDEYYLGAIYREIAKVSPPPKAQVQLEFPE